ncbi:hypothetical protein RJ639_034912 [Escallonia herrerae]|uniref:Late embryogenesis abundant protein LEA-2 subgroup domain-containing protein n=1 Tax=Escallonia herrerae TaxID=1293975 RepID=A0AA88WRM6_9ASTE|nr:hypothetical protein RJ639_034912 [Escallonia herrerae]
MGYQSNRPVTGYPAPGYPQSGPNPNQNGAAFACAAPPPPQYYNQNPYYAAAAADPYAAHRATFLRRIFAVLIASVIIAGTVIFIVWLVVRPRIPQFRVDSVALSNFNSSSSLLTGNWDVRLTVRNPNSKANLAYDDINAYMFYRRVSLAETAIPPFSQGTKNETAVRATFAAARTYVEKWVLDGLNTDRASGKVDFTMTILARVRFKAGAWRARRRLLRVVCPNLSVNNSSGSLVGGSRGCRVGF